MALCLEENDTDATKMLCIFSPVTTFLLLKLFSYTLSFALVCIKDLLFGILQLF